VLPTITKAVFNATIHLAERGCKKNISLGYKNDYSIVKRRDGYLGALNVVSFPINREYIIDCTDDKDLNYKLLKRALITKTQTEFGSGENLAFISYKVCNELKILIPDNLKWLVFLVLKWFLFSTLP
jgi:LacI family transcriptional regulator